MGGKKDSIKKQLPYFSCDRYGCGISGLFGTPFAAVFFALTAQ
ncbi:MAG: hypothetical protein QM793_15105 [Muricomes sp.]